MVYGIKAADIYPENATIQMSSYRSGLKLLSLLGNTTSYLIVDSKMKNIIESNSNVEIEYLGFDLLDLEGRVHSDDYFIVNPIGARECLNHDLSEVEYFEEDRNEVVDVHRFVLDPSKLEDEPILFRIKEEPTEYVISEALLRILRDEKFTNIFVEEIEQVEVKTRS